ncbi:hypothetical protein JMJ77_0010698, partial [Colletotrichum scovillei]
GWLAEVRSYTGRSSRRRLRCALDGPFGRLQCCTPHCARGRTSQSTVLARCRHSPSQMTPDAPRDCKAWRGQSDPIACVSQASQACLSFRDHLCSRAVEGGTRNIHQASRK